MKRLYFLFLTSALLFQIFISASCTGVNKLNKDDSTNSFSGEYTIYIVNNNLHTGIVIPADDRSIGIISALKNFKDFQFADIGWGEERFYQDPSDNICMGARAILLPNSSVIRIEGYSGISDIFISWSDFTVKLTLSEDQFIKLAEFIEKSFRMESGNELIITSKKNSGGIIFFKSNRKYYLFKTCNTWVADALKYSGFEVSPFFIITAGQLFKEIKDQGVVLKSLN